MIPCGHRLYECCTTVRVHLRLLPRDEHVDAQTDRPAPEEARTSDAEREAGDMNIRQLRGRVNRCGMTLYPIHAAPYPCPKRAGRYGMCAIHVNAMERKMQRIGLRVKHTRGVARVLIEK